MKTVVTIGYNKYLVENGEAGNIFNVLKGLREVRLKFLPGESCENRYVVDARPTNLEVTLKSDDSILSESEWERLENAETKLFDRVEPSVEEESATEREEISRG